MTDAAPTPDSDPVEATVDGEPEAAVADPDELMKQKYRDAMAHKHGASGGGEEGPRRLRHVGALPERGPEPADVPPQVRRLVRLADSACRALAEVAAAP